MSRIDTQTPVVIYAEAARFKAARHLAKALSVPASTVRRAAIEGSPVKGYFIRYADMPLECQPIPPKPHYAVPVIWEGKPYPSIMAAAGGDRAKWNRIWRASVAAGHRPQKRKRRMCK